MEIDLGTIESLLPYALPPLIGAVIGYITNAVAIKMLFRPLYEKRIGRLRIPFTPGIIPRQRSQLAGSIGNMVSRQLITEDAVRRQIASPAFRSTIAGRISSLTETFLYSPVRELRERFGRIAGDAPAEGGGAGDTEISPETAGGKGTVASLIDDLLLSFVRGEPFGRGMRFTLEFGMKGLGRRKLSALIGERGEKLDEIAGTSLLEKIRPAVRKGVQESLVRGIRNNVHLSSLFTAQMIDGVCRFLDRLYPDLLESLVAYLRDPVVKRQLEKRGRSFLRDVIEKLNNLQRFVIIAGQYDRTLQERMHVIVEDAIRQFERAGREEENRQRLIEMLRERLHRFSRTSLGELAAYWGEEEFIEDAGRAVDLLFDWLTSEQGGRRMQRALEHLARRWGDSTVDEVVREVTGEPVEHHSPQIAAWIVNAVQGPAETEAGDAGEGGKSAGGDFFRSFVRVLSDEGALSAAEIFDMDRREKEELDRRLFGLLTTVLDEQVPMILESVDVKTLVVEKIESLDMEQVERLLLEVIRTHLRWIIIFGAFLGFLIGAVQVVLIRSL